MDQVIIQGMLEKELRSIISPKLANISRYNQLVIAYKQLTFVAQYDF